MTTNGPRPVIGLPLYGATKAALEKLREHLPKGAIFDVVPAKEKEYVEEWAAALSGITLEAIIDAAGRWLRDEAHIDSKGRTAIPTIASYARYARNVDFAHWRPPLTLSEQRPRTLPGRIHELTVRAIRSLGSRELAEEVWGVLIRSAAPGAPSQAVREGRVTDEDFDIAIALVRESDRLAKAKRTA
ncbi:hypothetical protein [Gemmatimonas sp.]|uniref:hypothetical protein n=1 Tax=Gemmatimonas sp. TaxID=1962908 RepID=UPI0025BEF859|nr:hypothetical protein [Gemmatimonas sp.]MCA2991057.1 hypothetical protein [Gemmatimonas sp.]